VVPADLLYHQHTINIQVPARSPGDISLTVPIAAERTSHHPYISGLQEDSQNGTQLGRFDASPIDDATILRDLGSVLKGAVVGSCEPCHLGTLTTVRRAWVWHGIVHACTRGD
jgi:hypothetical protein